MRRGPDGMPSGPLLGASVCTPGRPSLIAGFRGGSRGRTGRRGAGCDHGPPVAAGGDQALAVEVSGLLVLKEGVERSAIKSQLVATIGAHDLSECTGDAGHALGHGRALGDRHRRPELRALAGAGALVLAVLGKDVEGETL